MPQNPNFVPSIIMAGFRLYIASFIYTLGLSLSVGLTALLITYFFKIQKIDLILVSIYSCFVTTIFVIPLVKRIHCVGLGLPVKPGEAFQGFMGDYLRIISLICIYALIDITSNIFIFVADFQWYTYVVTLCSLFVINLYITLHIYFANLFVILENKSVKDGITLSSHISKRDLWLTLGVLSFIAIVYLLLARFIAPYFNMELLKFNIVMFFGVVIGTPLFLCIQLVQYYNLNR